MVELMHRAHARAAGNSTYGGAHLLDSTQPVNDPYRLRRTHPGARPPAHLTIDVRTGSLQLRP